MIYLFCALLGLAALVLAGTMREGDSYGRCARLVEQEGGTLFALFAYTTVGDKECDIDLSRYGCAPGAHLAEIALKHGRFHLRGLAQVAREDGSVNCLDEEVALRQGDMITLTMADGHPLQLRFEWE